MNFYEVDEDGIENYNPLLFAVAFNKISFVEMLLRNGVNINARDALGGTALVNNLVKSGYKIKMLLRSSKNTYEIPVGKIDNSIFKMLFAAGANPMIRDNSGKIALRYAALYGNYEAVEMLVNSNPESIDISDNKGDTALILAAAGGLKML